MLEIQSWSEVEAVRFRGKVWDGNGVHNPSGKRCDGVAEVMGFGWGGSKTNPILITNNESKIKHGASKKPQYLPLFEPQVSLIEIQSRILIYQPSYPVKWHLFPQINNNDQSDLIYDVFLIYWLLLYSRPFFSLFKTRFWHLFLKPPSPLCIPALTWFWCPTEPSCPHTLHGNP